MERVNHGLLETVTQSRDGSAVRAHAFRSVRPDERAVVIEFSDLTAGSSDLLGWRRRARALVVAAHLAGVLIPGVLMFTTEGPTANFGSGTANVTAAWLNVAAIAVVSGGQAAALIAWWRCGKALRATAGNTRRRHGRLVLKGCAALLLLTAWTAEAGFAAEAVSAIRSGGWDEPVDSLGMGLIAAAMLAGGFALAIGVLVLTIGIVARAVARQFRALAPRGW